jgi:hypothetical protein
MRDMENVSNLREDFNVDGHVFEEVRIFKYFSASTTGKTELVTKTKTRTGEDNLCYYSLQHNTKN